MDQNRCQGPVPRSIDTLSFVTETVTKAGLTYPYVGEIAPKCIDNVYSTDSELLYALVQFLQFSYILSLSSHISCIKEYA